MQELFDDIFSVELNFTENNDTELNIDFNDEVTLSSIETDFDLITSSGNSNVDVSIIDNEDFVFDTGVTPSTISNTNYEDLSKKPKIEGVTLIGDKTFEDLNFAIDKIDCGTSTTVI